MQPWRFVFLPLITHHRSHLPLPYLHPNLPPISLPAVFLSSISILLSLYQLMRDDLSSAVIPFCCLFILVSYFILYPIPLIFCNDTTRCPLLEIYDARWAIRLPEVSCLFTIVYLHFSIYLV
jgi:hypothetical protein